MAHSLGNARRAKITLNATNRQLITLPDGVQAGAWLDIRWAEEDQSAGNLVYVETGAGLTDNVSRGTGGSVQTDVHPGGNYHQMVWVSGSPVAVSGSSAFDITIAYVQ